MQKLIRKFFRLVKKIIRRLDDEQLFYHVLNKEIRNNYKKNKKYYDELEKRRKKVLQNFNLDILRKDGLC